MSQRALWAITLAATVVSVAIPFILLTHQTH